MSQDEFLRTTFGLFVLADELRPILAAAVDQKFAPAVVSDVARFDVYFPKFAVGDCVRVITKQPCLPFGSGGPALTLPRCV